MAHIDGISVRAKAKGSRRTRQLRRRMHIHSCPIELDYRIDLIRIRANHGHVGLVRSQDEDLPERSAID